ncbi:glucose 1-dehydrogenase [Ktedonosporobacter rubrisoli]|uniref:Glucose 1-dehydrogenase n=1 Tax=Ktedonosporobacter rubrisoli TaxID=2509675 RepID=A0A4P6JI25_KTERU|nr:glucose 1-dehydrogenase [Ktedonosporobacter rubrisoli]QBD74603.1 glucose 1-dehydrogenase [Ktedonosporobacter rubrisoli]
MGKLDGKVAVITGANSGIGLATAKLFVAEGAFVYITGRRQKELDAAVSQLGKQALAIQGDIANLEDLDRLYATVKQHHGKIDILFANAAINGEYRPLGMITEAQFADVFNVNVKGTLFTVQKALPLLQDGGVLVLTASLAASTGAAAMSVYNAAKAAVRTFARTWAVELSARKIRVNAMSPGGIQTPGLDSIAPDDMKDAVAAHALMKRLGSADEIARAVLFLASDESSFITGTELHVDGGASVLH